MSTTNRGARNGRDALHDHTRRLGWLRTAVDSGLINHPLLAKHDSLLESLRGDASFEDLMQQVQRRWQAFPSPP